MRGGLGNLHQLHLAGESAETSPDREPGRTATCRPTVQTGAGMFGDFGGPELSPFQARPFAPNIPALDLFPTRIWNRLTNRVQRNPSRHLMNYGAPAGFRPLRRAIADYVAESRGVHCESDQVIITSGTQKA